MLQFSSSDVPFKNCLMAICLCLVASFLVFLSFFLQICWNFLKIQVWYNCHLSRLVLSLNIKNRLWQIPIIKVYRKREQSASVKVVPEDHWTRWKQGGFPAKIKLSESRDVPVYALEWKAITSVGEQTVEMARTALTNVAPAPHQPSEKGQIHKHRNEWEGLIT